MTRIPFYTFVVFLLTIVPMSAQDFVAGQVWLYDTRPQDERSKLTILRIDTLPDVGAIFHISVDQLSLLNPYSPNGFHTNMQHIPVSEETLRASVTKLEGTTPSLPDVPEGYWTWKDAFDQGSAGVWDIPLKDIIDRTEEALAKPFAL